MNNKTNSTLKLKKQSQQPAAADYLLQPLWRLRRATLRYIFLFLLLAFWGVWQVSAQSSEVLVLQIEGPVTPAMANYFERGIAAGEASNAAAVVIILNTPGGSVDVTQDIVRTIRAANVPVIVYVSPRGAQAASAGSIITVAAHAAGMAPETVIGAASPVGGGGEDLGETVSRKIIEDLKAQMRGLTERRGPEAVTLAEQMIEEARAVNAREALAVGLIDAVADSVPDLLVQLDGLPVEVAGEERILQTAVSPTRSFGMSTLEQVLHALANPLLISILLAIGVQAILIELSNPGGWVAGFIGVLCLGLAAYGLGQLPVNWLGLGLIAVALVLFVAEVFATNHGALGVTGAVTMLIGLLVLFNSPGSPEFARISIPGAVGVSLFTAAFFIFIATKALQAQRRQPTTGAEGLVGMRGPVRRPSKPEAQKPPYEGMALINGELWRVQSDMPLAKDDLVQVTAVSGFVLHVKPLTSGEGSQM